MIAFVMSVMGASVVWWEVVSQVRIRGATLRPCFVTCAACTHMVHTRTKEVKLHVTVTVVR